MVLDVVSVPNDTCVANDADIFLLALLEPLLHEKDASPNFCADVDVVKLCEPLLDDCPVADIL